MSFTLFNLIPTIFVLSNQATALSIASVTSRVGLSIIIRNLMIFTDSPPLREACS